MSRYTMRRINLWHKSKLSPAKLDGTSRKDQSNYLLPNKLSVNEEYLQTFRTKSFIEMWDKVQIHLSKTTTSITPPPPISSKLSTNFYLDPSKSLLEPHQDTLNQIINESSNVHQLLVDYFEASLKAYNICQLLLQSIHQIRSDNKGMKKVIKIINKRLLVDQECEEHQQCYCPVIFRELKLFSMHKNPLSIVSPIHEFQEIHDVYLSLLRQLTSKRKKIKRKSRVYRFWKRVGGVGLVILCSALFVALIVFTFHSVFGIFAAPALMAWPFALFKKKKKKKKKKKVELLSRRGLEGLSEQLDVAAKGVFIMINDFDTMSRMVRRLNDEIEHRKSIAEICVRNEKCELLREVVKEFCAHESSFMEQLEELEAHIYLCLLTINRSRRLVIQEIIENQ